MKTLTYSLFLLILVSILIVVGVIIAALLTLTQSNTAELNYDNTPSISSAPPVKYSDFVTNLFTQDSGEAGKETQDTFSDWQESENIKYTQYTPDTSEVVVSGGTLESPTTEETPSSPDTSTPGFDIWGWLPTTKVSTPRVEEGPSPINIAIKTYANTLGDSIQIFTTQAGDQPKILQEFIEGRGTPGNSEALMSLGESYINLSRELQSIVADDLIPLDVRNRGDNLARSYTVVGEATKHLTNAEPMNDEDTIAAIYDYNAQIDIFAKDYLAFVTIIGAYGVTFTRGEGGDIFMLLR
jgi:hypothetical protein